MNISGNGGISEVCPITTIALFILIFNCDEKGHIYALIVFLVVPQKRYDGKSRLGEQVRSLISYSL